MGLKRALPAVLVFLTVACNEPSIPFGDQSGTSGRPKPAELQGALHAALGSDWGDFDRALGTINPWTGGHEQNRCSDAFLCGFTFSKVPVRIQANPESMFADFTSVGANGTILIKLQNAGHRPTHDYALEPLPTVYYVVVKQSGAASWQWVIVENKGPNSNRQVGEWQNFTDCQPHHMPKKSVANFQNCHDPEPGIKQASLVGVFGVWTTMAKQIVLSIFDEAPGWVSCAYGCCTVTY